MPENEHDSREAHANWKAPEGAAEKTENQTEQDEDKGPDIKFDPERRPGIPHGARFKKGRTVFHEMAQLWDEAKAEHDYLQSKMIPHQATGGAIQRYEEYSNYVGRWYEMLTKAMDAASEAVKTSGLDPKSKEANELYDQTRRQYEKDHFEPLPQWMKERRENQDRQMKEKDEQRKTEAKEERKARRKGKEKTAE